MENNRTIDNILIWAAEPLRHSCVPLKGFLVRLLFILPTNIAAHVGRVVSFVAVILVVSHGCEVCGARLNTIADGTAYSYHRATIIPRGSVVAALWN